MKKVFVIFSILAMSALSAFDSYEHEYLGDKAVLHGIDSNMFVLENGIKISFGQLVAMGDFYGIAEEPIAIDIDTKKEIDDVDELDSRFMDAYNSLSKGNRDEVEDILNILGEEKDTIKKAIEDGKSEIEAYETIASKENVEFEITTSGRYADISACNFDHFVDSDFNSAKKAFLAGYNHAINIVKNAKPNEIEKLKQAYCIYGFACHYLTDCFSSGHVRVPRFELTEEIEGPFHTQISGLLALYQHQEDCYFGVNVSNVIDHWKAYGDACLFQSSPSEISMPVLAIQKGINDIYNVFIKKIIDDKCSIEDFIPHLASNNFSPLFKIDEDSKKLLRRVDITDRECSEYTDDWYGLSTLLKLYLYQVGNPDTFLKDCHLNKMEELFYLSCVKPNSVEASEEVIAGIEKINSLPEISDEEIADLASSSLKEEDIKDYLSIFQMLNKFL
jgi:hypothetical protein